MLDRFNTLIIDLHAAIGPGMFLTLSIGLGAACVGLIAWTTDLMVNNAAGLAGKHINPEARTLVINASTNNPEAATMAVSMAMGRMGGWANPLGSLLANCYLMYLVAIVLVALKWAALGRFDRIGALVRLIVVERRLVAWHLVMALACFVPGTVALWLMRNGLTFTAPDAAAVAAAPPLVYPQTGVALWLAIALLLVSIILFFIVERRLKAKRPGLFADIHSEHHSESWIGFIGGTSGLILTCWLMNAMFLAWTLLYGERLEAIFGATVFTALHYLIGGLMTSLPELLVATRNYQQLTVPDLNTALGSASYSNVTNLVIALLGLIVFALLARFGVILPWG